jgi:hypothetical protein
MHRMEAGHLILLSETEVFRLWYWVLLTKYEEMRPERPLVELKKKKAY